MDYCDIPRIFPSNSLIFGSFFVLLLYCVFITGYGVFYLEYSVLCTEYTQVCILTAIVDSGPVPPLPLLLLLQLRLRLHGC